MDKNNVTKSDAGDNDTIDYKRKAIYNSAVYIRESAGNLSRLYYLIF